MVSLVDMIMSGSSSSVIIAEIRHTTTEEAKST
jgi:hypothetical protein